MNDISSCSTNTTLDIESAIICIRIPMQKLNIGKQGKQLLILPAKSDTTPKYAPDRTMVKALAQSYYWQKLLDNGKLSSAKAIARKYKMQSSRVSLMLQLNMLSPKIRLALLNGTQPRTMNMDKLKKPFPDKWHEQIAHFRF